MKTANGIITWAGAETRTLGATRTSDPFPVKNMDLLAIAATISAASSLNGTLKLQACVDHGFDPGQGLNNVTGLTNFVDVAGTSTTVTADGTTIWNLSNIGWRWVRVVYTHTGGDATLALRANAKGRT